MFCRHFEYQERHRKEVTTQHIGNYPERWTANLRNIFQNADQLILRIFRFLLTSEITTS